MKPHTPPPPHSPLATAQHCPSWHGGDAAGPGCPCIRVDGHLGGHVCAAGFTWGGPPPIVDMRGRVRGILGSWYERHRFYADAANDEQVLDAIAAEICRTIDTKGQAQ